MEVIYIVGGVIVVVVVAFLWLIAQDIGETDHITGRVIYPAKQRAPLA